MGLNGTLSQPVPAAAVHVLMTWSVMYDTSRASTWDFVAAAQGKAPHFFKLAPHDDMGA